MASKDGSARRSSRPSADPLHIAKRKRLIAEEFARSGTHSAIKKSISWGDIGRHDTGSPTKRGRVSLSESITPGLSDMSTPTPINRPRPSLKSSSGQKSILISRPNTQSKGESTSKPAPVSQQTPPRFTLRAPTPQRPQTQPEVINLISDENSQSDQNPKSVDSRDAEVQPHSHPSGSKQGSQSQQNIDSPALASPTSDVGTQYQEQNIPSDDRPVPQSHRPSPGPSSGVIVSQKRPAGNPSAQAAGKHSLALPTSPSRRKRRTSEIGIQTIPDKEVDWLGDLDIEDSMSAIEISRVWAEKRSGANAEQELSRELHQQPESEPDEPLAGNFLDEFEGRSPNNGVAAENLDSHGHSEQTGEFQEQSSQPGEQDVEAQDVDPEDILGHAPASSRASSPAALPAPISQSGRLESGTTRYRPSATSPLRFPSFPPRESISIHPPASVQPYPFGIQGRKPAGATEPSQKDKNVAQADVEPRPFSFSQPNPYVAGPRARSRLYTPQPVPPPRNMNLNELRAAPTLGRSTLGAQPATEPTKSAEHNSSRAESDIAKSSESGVRSLKAAPTLGRSTDWGLVSPSRPAASDSGERHRLDLGHQPTGYGVGYGSVPEVPSDYPSRPPSSPEHYAWEVEPVHASTPHRMVTQMSTMAKALTQDKSVKANPLAETPQASTLAELEKKRRYSVAPLAESKKIRRDYDTVESNAVPNVRAHRDMYDESGRRSWVPKRPNMKRALDAPTPSAKKVVKSKYPAPVVEVPEPADEVRGQTLPESAVESRAETFEPVSYGEPMQEHQMELDEQPGQALEYETRDKATRPSTEIAETPQSTRIRDPYDLATSELYSNRFTSEQAEQVASPKPADYAYVPHSNKPDASAMQVDEPLYVNATQEGNLAFTPVTERVPPSSEAKSSQRTRFDGRSTKKAHSRPKRPSSGLLITPARQPVWSPPRTRLSLGGRSGISLLQVSKSDQDILIQAGLRPILKRLSDAHGFTVDVVAGVYQETGSLRETEDTLEKMKNSAERTRASISRRRSTVEVLHGEERGLDERDNSEISGDNNDHLNWDTSRMSSRILFGEGL
ncbi:unnamed protein product [Rhizoctonia solani]|uniref:Uncharacterized protein n=1 Tax=Rhizoctonia solani TaxID=456999 RepID=A0A8H3HFL0_9AGAM|nr:unnamed protein product [Rhizoctonia solani]